MNEAAQHVKLEIDRMFRVSDMMVTAHSKLRDSYDRRANIFDIIVLLLTAWVTLLGFASDDVIVLINPTSLLEKHLVGFMGAATFALVLLQLRTDWKGKGVAHDAAARAFSGLKNDLALMKKGLHSLSESDVASILHKYSAIGEMSVKIPEEEFLKLKAYHKRKIEISKYLDDHPSALLVGVRIRLCIRDNIMKSRWKYVETLKSSTPTQKES